MSILVQLVSIFPSYSFFLLNFEFCDILIKCNKIFHNLSNVIKNY